MWAWFKRPKTLTLCYFNAMANFKENFTDVLSTEAFLTTLGATGHHLTEQ
jgi:hypothetical protein